MYSRIVYSFFSCSHKRALFDFRLENYLYSHKYRHIFPATSNLHTFVTPSSTNRKLKAVYDFGLSYCCSLFVSHKKIWKQAQCQFQVFLYSSAGQLKSIIWSTYFVLKYWDWGHLPLHYFLPQKYNLNTGVHKITFFLEFVRKRGNKSYFRQWPKFARSQL